MSRGFSLIELLTVIAIIGVLSSVVLISITSARDKGIDAGVKENLHTIHNQAEFFRSNTNTFGTAVAVQGSPITVAPTYSASGANFLISDRQANSALDAAVKGGDAGYYAIGVGGGSWAVAVALKSVTGYWCVDVNGTAKVITSATLGGGTSAAACP